MNRFASFTRITHNDIFDTHWNPIGLDARWSYRGESYSRGNEVAYNHLHHLGLRYHADAGGIYQFGPLDTHIHHNVIHDTRAYPYICGFAGVYLDEQSRGARVENNLVHNVEWFAYFQHKGVDNVFRNNIGAFARDGFFHRGGLSEQWRTNSCEVSRNLYIARDAVAIKQSWEPGLVPPVLRQNMSFSATAGTALTFAGKGFAEWQAAGQDAASVLGDPGCRAPENGDFSLRPDAGAVTAIGFQPFDDEIRKAGLYGDAAWVALPSRCSQRSPSAVWMPDDLARLVGFSMDFEDMPDGYEPTVFRLTKEGAATFAVTSEAACTGTKSYKCMDRKGLKKPFYPYIHVAPRQLTRGRITFSLDAMNSPQSPARFCAEFRGKGSVQDVGPSIRCNRDGAVVANGRPVLAVRHGTWFHLDVLFELGENAPREYTLVTRYDGKEERQRIPFTHPTFREISWLGICAEDDADGVFYLDNLVFRIE
ncbi:MAG: right-handed parallel beta-helix repeat-containing protein [Planctomycetes bacterium]|nr:right-handed parallel beta-helix repeat-containing protein [Planctomycetota bacterium]